MIKLFFEILFLFMFCVFAYYDFGLVWLTKFALIEILLRFINEIRNKKKVKQAMLEKI